MKVHFWIPQPLAPLVNGQRRVSVETQGGVLRDALEALFAAHPALRDRILTERGDVREHVNLFVGEALTRTTGGLATPIAEGVEIAIMAAISGG